MVGRPRSRLRDQSATERVSFLEQPRRTEMAAPEEGSTSISARRVDTMEKASKIGGTEYAEAAQWSRRLERREERARKYGRN